MYDIVLKNIEHYNDGLLKPHQVCLYQHLTVKEIHYHVLKAINFVYTFKPSE